MMLRCRCDSSVNTQEKETTQESRDMEFMDQGAKSIKTGEQTC